MLKHEGDGGCHGDSVRELELTCVALQHQVDEMEVREGGEEGGGRTRWKQ